MKKLNFALACGLVLGLALNLLIGLAFAEVSSTNGAVTTTGTVSGAVTSVTSADSSVSVATTTTTPVLTCATASGSQKGCLTSADWTTFNNKQATHTATAPIVVTGADISCTAAAAGVAGCVSTGAQTYDGVKTFSSVPLATGISASGTAVFVETSSVANGSSAVAHRHNNTVTFSTNGAKLDQWQNNGTAKTSISKDGAINLLTSDQTGSPGAATINAASGKFAFATGSASTITITNSLVSGTSIVLCTPQTTNAAATSLRCTAGAGGFDAQPNAAPTTAAWEIQFVVFNQNVP